MERLIERRRVRGILMLLLGMVLWGLPASSPAQITVTTIHAPVNTLSINDLDFLNATTPKWLFTITMASQSPQPIEVEMTIRLDVYLTGGKTYENAAIFYSKPFILNQTKTVTNLELGRGRGIPQRDVDGYVFNEQAKAAFLAISLPSGSMPAGTYRFTVNVTATGGGSDSKEFAFVLSNPSSPVLLSPTSGETVAEEFPLFQWQYDGPRATIAIYEMLPGQRSLEEATSGPPHATATVTTRSFRYPVTGARPLTPGKSYVWFVKGIVGVVGGTELELRSPLWSFTVASTRATSMSWLLHELESALPPSYKPLFDQIRTQSLSPTGVIRLNGTTITVADLLNLLNDIRTNPETISSVNLE